MEVIDNFISESDANFLENLFLKNNNQIWNFVHNSKHPYFCHLLYNLHLHSEKSSHETSPLFKHVQPILSKLNRIRVLLRIKVNLYLQKDNVQVQDMHTDYPFETNAGCYFINTNNGYLSFEDGTTIDAKKGRVALFKGNTKHAASYCSDKKIRGTINFNYIENLD